MNSADLANTTIISDNLADNIQKLQQQEGEDILHLQVTRGLRIEKLVVVKVW